MKLPSGQGLFIWKLYNCGSPESVIARCRDIGLGHLCVKFADGCADHAAGEQSYHPAIRALMPRARAAGLEVWGWPYIYGNDPSGEAQAEARWFRELGFDGFIIDAEAEYKNRAGAAAEYARTLRAELPEATIALSSYWCPSYHPEFPWAAFDEIVDFHMPQVYWWHRDPRECLRRSVAELSPFGKPIVPTGGDFNDRGLTAADMLAFADEARALGLPALNWWHWEGARDLHWTAIKSINWEASPMPTPAPGHFCNDVADVARWAAEAYAAGASSIDIKGVVFNLTEKGMCAKFVRQCHEAVLGLRPFGWLWAAPSAACMEYHLRSVGKQVLMPSAGDIVFFSTGIPEARLNDLEWQRRNNNFGHAGIYLGGSPALFVENTSSASRGTGTSLSRMSEMVGRAPTFYHVLPARAGASSLWGEKEMEWCRANGIMTDVSRPHDPVTRQEAAAMLYRLRQVARKADHDPLATRLAALENPE